MMSLEAGGSLGLRWSLQLGQVVRVPCRLPQNVQRSMRTLKAWKW